MLSSAESPAVRGEHASGPAPLLFWNTQYGVQSCSVGPHWRAVREGLSDFWRRMADELPEGWECTVKRGVDGRYLVQYVSPGERGSTYCAP